LIHEKRETFLKKIENRRRESEIEIKQDNGYKKLKMASLKIQYDPLSVSNVIFFGSLGQNNPPYLKFFLKNLDVFKKINFSTWGGWMAHSFLQHFFWKSFLGKIGKN
jgi:hypothetical protein